MPQSNILSSETQKIRELTKPQDEFIFAIDEFVFLKGTWGCGKSLAGLIAACRECEEYPNNLYLIIRKEWVDLRDSTMKDWMDEFGDMYPIIGNDARLPNGSILMFRHGDDINALKNVNLGGALMVQGEEMTEDDFWFLKGRLRRKEGTRQLRVECNYDGHNWIYRLANEKKKSDGSPFEGGKLITTNTFDNKKNLPDDYIPGLMKLPKNLRDRHLYGSDADMEGVVWSEFDRSRHVIDPFYIPNQWKKLIALDHGVTNPTAVIFSAVDWDGTVIIYDEHYEAGKPVSYHAEAIKNRKIEDGRYWIDPSCFAKTQSKDRDYRSIADEYKDYGVIFNPADNTLLTGINRVNEFFKTDKIKIFRSCENTIREIENWKWRKLKPGVYKNQPDEPMDKDDHLCDCIRYIIMSRFGASELTIKNHTNPDSPWGRAQEIKKRKEQYVH